MAEQKVFVVYLGGQYPDSRFGEDHQTVHVVASTKVEAKKLARQKWVGNPDGVHVDSILQLDVIDGYQIILEKTSSDDCVEVVAGYSDY